MTPTDVRRFALALPGTVEQPHFAMTSFRVAGRIFATMPPEGNAVHLFLTEGDRDHALDLHRDVAEALMWGKRVAGVRLVLAKAGAGVVRDLLECAWAAKAPAALRATRNRGQRG